MNIELFFIIWLFWIIAAAQIGKTHDDWFLIKVSLWFVKKPDWADAPDWANWCAMDSKGNWFWYFQKPFVSGDLWVLAFRTSPTRYWMHTLQERPRGLRA
jgi:hypothetical protein